jgi:hypothetical protein
LKKILGILAILLFATASMVTATGNEPVIINEKYDILNVDISTAWREGRTIVYAVNETPINIAGDGKFLGYIKANGVNNLQPAIKEFAYKHRTNIIWHYNENFYYNGKFSITKAEYLN